MLVLCRRVGESVFIADNIELTVLEVRGKRVRIGICAPSDVVIRRKEIIVNCTTESGFVNPQLAVPLTSADA